MASCRVVPYALALASFLTEERGAQGAPQLSFSRPYDSYNVELLPDAFASPSLPDLTHRSWMLNVETNGASIQPKRDQTVQERSNLPRSFALLYRVEAERAVWRRQWYVGGSLEGAYGRSPEGNQSSLLLSYPELWVRGVWASLTGLAYGGGLRVVVPTFRRTPGGTASAVAQNIRTVRPWDFAAYADNTITVSPYIDARVIDGQVTIQLRQTFDLQGLVADVRTPRASVVSHTNLFLGYRPVEKLGVGLELWETYLVNVENLPDDRRAVFAISPGLRWIGKTFQPAVSMVFPFESLLFDQATSYWSVRASFTWVWGQEQQEGGKDLLRATPSPSAF